MKILKSTALLGAIFFAFISCEEKKDQVVVEEGIIVDDTIHTDDELTQAEIRLKEAEIELQRAKDSGDKEAERRAQEARDEAQRIWDNIKAGANDAVAGRPPGP